MKHTTFFESLNDLLDDVARATLQAARGLGRRIGAMSWGQLFASAVLLAMLITILPMALTLFIAFMLVKLVVDAIVIQSRRHKSPVE